MSSPTSTEKLAAIVLAVAAVLSPLYIDHKSAEERGDEDDGGGRFSPLLPVLLILLIATITLITCFTDRRFTRFDPYWIHRVGGSSFGIFVFLVVLGFVLKCKTFSW
ncbi:hypothetical protein KSP40_PGU008865 [Platanthera guangdongensis]|uniref:Transmembrane protein n=1 Tax=Platanthera guangdongensis TaxID=2320717 RepID=A0ABR2MZP6_9ASPA